MAAEPADFTLELLRKIDRKLDDVIERMTALEARSEKLEAAQEDVRARMGNMERGVEQLASGFNGVLQIMGVVSNRLNVQSSDIAAIRKHLNLVDA